MVTERIREDLIPATEHEMDTLECEAKENYKKAQEAGLSGALREFADEIDNKKEQKFDKERLEKMSTTVLSIARKGAITIASAQRAERAYHTGRDVSEQVIKRKSDTKRWNPIPKTKKGGIGKHEYECRICHYSHEDYGVVRMHIRDYHEPADNGVRVFFFINLQIKLIYHN